MKTVTLVFLCFLGVLAIVGLAHSQNGLCDNWGCSMDCFEQGLHGECGYDDICRCGQCIYRACRKVCMRQNQVGQCDDSNCLCL